jgi:C4-dicarboxylate transporter, DcuC family
MIASVFSLVFIIFVTILLVKKYNPQAVLLIAGLLMLVTAQILDLPEMNLQKPTGNFFFNLFAGIKEAFSKTNAEVGLLIMSIGGFVAYMNKIGASDVLVYWAMKPLAIFKKQPYIAASLVIPIGQVLFVAIPSAAGLSLLLMASLFPILIQLGVSKISAVSVITATTIFGIGPAGAITASAVDVLQLDIVLYFLKYQIPLVWPLSIFVSVIYYFVNRFYDQKMSSNLLIISEQNIIKPAAPAIYAILPLLPIVLLLVFSEIFQITETKITLETTTVMFLSLFVSLIFEAIRHRNFKLLFASLSVFWDGMGNIFKSVVTLIVCAEFFAKGLISLQFIDGLIALTTSIGFAGVGIGIILTLMIYLASMLMGSGNAAFFSFGPLVPNLAKQIGISSTALMLPMQLAASMGRAISPVSGVLIATSEIAGLTSMDIVKRNLIPITATLIFMFLIHFI